MAQYALPIADVATTNWAELNGDGDGDAFDELDEGFGAGRGSGSGPDDGGTSWETTDEASNDLRCDVGVVTDPAVSTGHITRVMAEKNSGGGRQLDLSFGLADPDSIFGDSTNTNITAAWNTYTHNLTGGEADTIDNYATLDVQVQILETGGGSPRIGRCSAMEFECPDAGGGPPGFVHSQAVVI